MRGNNRFFPENQLPVSNTQQIRYINVMSKHIVVVLEINFFARKIPRDKRGYKVSNLCHFGHDLLA
jgi:hypothetical protein